MVIFKGFRRKKKRKYPIKRDEHGKSAHSRCFEMFPDNISLDEISEIVNVKIETVRRYHRQWKTDPDFETRYDYAKKLLKTESPNRERIIELLAKACGITTEQFETILHQPHGLRRLMTGKLYFPGHAAADHKLYLAFEVAMTISNHLDKNGGSLEDVLFAFRRWMKENKLNREAEDEEIEEENDITAFAHRVLEAAAKQEREGRVKPDELSDEERNSILMYGVKARWRNLEKTYWLRIAELIGEGLTIEQAREKIYQDLVDKGDMVGARQMREYQDRVHPLKAKQQLPRPPPPKPPSPT